MRIDDSTRFSSQLSALQNHASRAFQLQQEISTGSRVNKPSDDPGMYQLKDELTQRLTGLDADQKFLTEQSNRLDNYDSGLGTLVDNLRQARTVVQRASNASTDPTAIGGLRDQMSRLIDSTLSILNQEVGGRYMFGGTKVEQPPFQRAGGAGPTTSVTYQGDQTFPGVPLPDGQKLNISLDGKSVTQSGDTELFQTLIELRDQLQDKNIDAEPHLSRLESLENHLLQRRSEAGSASRYLDQLKSHLQANEQQTRSELATYTEADLPTSITELMQNETAQQATFSVISRQAKLSLVDFLR